MGESATNGSSSSGSSRSDAEPDTIPARGGSLVVLVVLPNNTKQFPFI